MKPITSLISVEGRLSIARLDLLICSAIFEEKLQQLADGTVSIDEVENSRKALEKAKAEVNTLEHVMEVRNNPPAKETEYKYTCPKCGFFHYQRGELRSDDSFVYCPTCNGGLALTNDGVAYFNAGHTSIPCVNCGSPMARWDPITNVCPKCSVELTREKVE